MVPQTHVFPGKPNRITVLNLRLRRGGPGHRPGPRRDERHRLQGTGENIFIMHGSHMPLDTMLHWRWDNPLNIIPLLITATLLLAFIGMMV
jgi:hypothetical protein